jgi:hypothetical protein
MTLSLDISGIRSQTKSSHPQAVLKPAEVVDLLEYSVVICPSLHVPEKDEKSVKLRIPLERGAIQLSADAFRQFSRRDFPVFTGVVEILYS